MTHISLFSGVGGIDLAAEWAGFETILQVEIDPYCQRVLEKHWPNVKRIEDIRDVKADSVSEPITLVSGGFPCQPVSVAGKRRGTEDDRWLWPEMLRVIREIAPKWVLAENVLGLLTIEHGMVFENILADLEVEGYETWTGLIPVAGTGAPHLRYRVFLVAHIPGNGMGNNRSKTKTEKTLFPRTYNRIRIQTHETRRPFELDQSNMDRIYDGIPHQLERNRALGNSCSPQQVYPILRAIAEIEEG